jgi:hypothetical protein
MEAGLRNQQQTTGLFCTDSTRTGDMFIGVFAEALVNNVTLPPRHWYVITISHERFDPSDLVSRLARPGCLAYGQWREYRILTSGTTDGTLDAQVNVPVTAIYIRRDAPPTEDLYDAVARWPLQRLAISGCEVDQPTVWYVAVTLERQWLADGRSPPLQQRRFQLTANLRQSNVSLMQMALGTRVSIPHNYLCCGVYRDFVVPELTRSLALEYGRFNIRVNSVLPGSVRTPLWEVRAKKDPKHQLALVFRAYLGQASRWANDGVADRKLDYQVWCGPAMGAFNAWVRGTFLEPVEDRTVRQIALNLLEGAATVTRAGQFRAAGVAMPVSAFDFRPRPLG